jgi:hypothetical protein
MPMSDAGPPKMRPGRRVWMWVCPHPPQALAWVVGTVEKVLSKGALNTRVQVRWDTPLTPRHAPPHTHAVGSDAAVHRLYLFEKNRFDPSRPPAGLRCGCWTDVDPSPCPTPEGQVRISGPTPKRVRLAACDRDGR